MLISHNFSLLVVDRLCDQARGQNVAVTCFYFDFADRKEQSATRALGSLLRQVVGGLERIPEEISGFLRGEKCYWWTRTATTRYREDVTGYHVVTADICMHRRSRQMCSAGSSKVPQFATTNLKEVPTHTNIHPWKASYSG